MRISVKVILGFIFASFVVVRCFAGSPNSETMDRINALTLDGLEDAYNFDFNGANNKFDEALSIDPSHPRPHVSKAVLGLWKFLMSKSDSDYQIILSLADKAIDAGEKYVEQHGDNGEAFICLGTSYGYRAFAHARTKSYLKAAWDAKKSYDYLYDAVKLDPHLYDAYLGLGLYHYYVASIPKPLQWIVSILGISGDSEQGMREIRTAMDKGFFTKTEAKYYYATLLPWYSGDYEMSEQILADLGRRYPNNAMFAFSLAVWEIRRNDVRTAKGRLASILSMKDKSIPAVDQFVHYKLAECYFRLQDYKLAISEYLAFLKEYHDDVYIATSNYRVGLCYELFGERSTALLYYEQAAKAHHNFGDDAYSVRHASVRLKYPLAASDTLMIAAQNALKSGNYDKAINLFMMLKSQPGNSPEELAEAEFGIGSAYFEKAAYADALQEFQAIFSISLRDERWLIPWARFQSALCYLKLNNLPAAKKEFEQVLSYDDYDFENWVSFRAKRELEQLHKKSGRG